ncbi:hypothetical protein LINPERPRIM_LOCUS24538 [Linum perenne]
MLDSDWMEKIEHIYREGNRTTDFLASFGHSLFVGIHDFSISDFFFPYHNDLFDISQTRLVLNEK